MPRLCSACAAESASVLCPQCGALRRPDEVEREGYFALFGLPEAYAVSRSGLETAYLALSRALHPDRHRDSPRLSAVRRLAALVNEGYAVLRDPLRRAEHLLARQGVKAAEPAPGFLEVQLAWREKAAEAPPAERAGLRAEVATRIDALTRKLADDLRDPAAPQGRLEARRTLDEMKYWGTLARLLEGA